MQHILIVEDDSMQLAYLSNVAHKIAPDSQVHCAKSTQEALDIIRHFTISAFFFDVHLSDGNGINLARHIRHIHSYQFTPMVFITGDEKPLLEAFKELHAYQYLVKPVQTVEVEKVFYELLHKRYLQNQPKHLTLSIKGVKILVNMDTILYVEHNHKLRVVTETEPIVYKHQSIKSFQEELDQRFIRIHQSFLINTEKIRSICINQSEIYVYGVNHPLPIGISYRKRLKAYDFNHC